MGLAALMTVAWGAFDVLFGIDGDRCVGLGQLGMGALQTSRPGSARWPAQPGQIALVGQRGLWPAIVGATIVLGAGSALTEHSTQGVALVVVATLTAGGALTVLDVVGRTLLQRVVDNAILTRMSG